MISIIVSNAHVGLDEMHQAASRRRRRGRVGGREAGVEGDVETDELQLPSKADFIKAVKERFQANPKIMCWFLGPIADHKVTRLLFVPVFEAEGCNRPSEAGQSELMRCLADQPIAI